MRTQSGGGSNPDRFVEAQDTVLEACCGDSFVQVEAVTISVLVVVNNISYELLVASSLHYVLQGPQY